MNRLFLISLFLIAGVLISKAQDIDNLMLQENEIPDDYTESDQLLCATPNSFSLYDQSEQYEDKIGKVVKKAFQTFQKKGDCGAILYFQFANEFAARAFIENTLWGKPGRPTKLQPDEYYAKGNVLVIWSFPGDSPMEKISKDKVMRLLL